MLFLVFTLCSSSAMLTFSGTFIQVFCSAGSCLCPDLISALPSAGPLSDTLCCVSGHGQRLIRNTTAVTVLTQIWFWACSFLLGKCLGVASPGRGAAACSELRPPALWSALGRLTQQHLTQRRCVRVLATCVSSL